MAPTHEDRIKSLKLKRVAFREELEQFRILLDNVDPGNATLYEVKLASEDLEAEYSSFCKSQPELDNADETGEALRERIQLRGLYRTCKARVLELSDRVDNRSQTNRTTRETQNNSTPLSHASMNDDDISLPKLHLPTFSGAIEDWRGFSDQFRTTVHENPRIADCKKLMYLRSCLSGQAAETIKPLSNIAANYAVALNMLEEYYNKPGIIIASHMRALFEVASLGKASYHNLRTFLSTIQSHYHGMQHFSQPTADTLLIYIFKSKLDQDTSTKWREHTKGTQFPTLQTFFNFLHERYEMLDPAVASSPTTSHSYTQPRAQFSPVHNTRQSSKRLQPVASQTLLTQSPTKCSFCNEAHLSRTCQRFLNLSVTERGNLVKEKNLCFNCLRRNHSVATCQASTSCRQCHKRHHTLLHIESSQSVRPVQVNSTYLSTHTPAQVLLSTAVVNIVGPNGRAHQCRMLLDSCSQSHFLTERACSRIGLITQKISVPVSGMNQMISNIDKFTNAILRSRRGNYTNKLTFLVAKEISQPLPVEHIDRSLLHIPKQLDLADPNFHEPSVIDGLIGAQLFWELLCVGQVALANKHTKLQKTKLGWVVTGEVPNNSRVKSIICNVTLDALQAQVNKFWDIEEGPSEHVLSSKNRPARTTSTNTQHAIP